MQFSRIGLATAGLVLALAVPAFAAPACDPADIEAAAAAIAEACPCDGRVSPSGAVTPWNNHGQYVSCVVRERNQVAKDLELPKPCLRRVASCGARSSCGKPGFVTCRIPDECSDLVADGVAEGTCADDPEVACDTAADCPVLRCSTKASVEKCEERGGIAGTGSCCD
ncbi:MAG: hypothetical protein FJ144_05680 [Deltaproteobacteria bacterium]|nr:hypothetical protein [Deltaproteobacteria bacterium]